MLHQLLHGGRQVEQPHRIGDVRAALAHLPGDVFLGLVELGPEPLVAARLVDRRQVGALQVLDQRDLQRFEIVEGPHHHRHVVQLRLLRRAPAPLAGDDLVGVGIARHRPHQDGLQQTELADRIHQRVEVLEGRARLIRAGAQMGERQGERRARWRRRPWRCGRRRRLRQRGGDIVVAEQGGETAAEAARFRRLAHGCSPGGCSPGGLLSGGLDSGGDATSAAIRRRRMNSLASRM